MEFSQGSTVNVEQFKKAPATRRVWTKPEEDTLILGLRDLIDKGWKADNGFRTGYLGQLEASMKKQFPTCNISGRKHINSKLTVWKKTYNLVKDMHDASGFGFNDERNMIAVTDDVWLDYVKVHPEVENMRFKSFPYYNDWTLIFGKDRANGGGAQQLQDAMLDMLQENIENGGYMKGKKKETGKGKNMAEDNNEGVNGIPVNLDSELEDDNFSCASKAAGGATKKDGSSNKREKKRCKTGEMGKTEPLVTLLGSLFEKNNVALESIAAQIAARNAPKPDKAKLVFDTIGTIQGLPNDLKIFASTKIVNSQYADLFLGMDNDSRAQFVSMILEGKF